MGGWIVNKRSLNFSTYERTISPAVEPAVIGSTTSGKPSCGADILRILQGADLQPEGGAAEPFTADFPFPPFPLFLAFALLRRARSLI